MIALHHTPVCMCSGASSKLVPIPHAKSDFKEPQLVCTIHRRSSSTKIQFHSNTLWWQHLWPRYHPRWHRLVSRLSVLKECRLPQRADPHTQRYDLLTTNQQRTKAIALKYMEINISNVAAEKMNISLQLWLSLSYFRTLG